MKQRGKALPWSLRRILAGMLTGAMVVTSVPAVELGASPMSVEAATNGMASVVRTTSDATYYDGNYIEAIGYKTVGTESQTAIRNLLNEMDMSGSAGIAAKPGSMYGVFRRRTIGKYYAFTLMVKPEDGDTPYGNFIDWFDIDGEQNAMEKSMEFIEKTGDVVEHIQGASDQIRGWSTKLGELFANCGNKLSSMTDTIDSSQGYYDDVEKDIDEMDRNITKKSLIFEDMSNILEQYPAMIERICTGE